MVQDGKAADDKRNLSRRKLAHQFVAVRVLPVQHRKVRPETASSMHALELVRDPARLFLLVGELNDANLLAFRALGAQQFFGKIDRKSTRLNSSHTVISYAVFCL